MPIDGWNGPRSKRDDPGEPTAIGSMTITGYAMALARARQANDAKFADQIRVDRLASIRAELLRNVGRVSDTERKSERFALQRKAFHDAMESLSTRSAEWWLQHGDDDPWDLIKAEIRK